MNKDILGLYPDDTGNPLLCSFGVISAPLAALIGTGLADAGIGTAAGAAAGAGGLLGAGATTALSTGLAGGLEGAALGAGTSALTHGNIGEGAGLGFLGGGLTAGLLPTVMNGLGLGADTTGAAATAGAATGAAGTAGTAGSVAGSALPGATTVAPTATGPVASGVGAAAPGGAGAAAGAAPPGIAAPIDQTSILGNAGLGAPNTLTNWASQGLTGAPPPPAAAAAAPGVAPQTAAQSTFSNLLDNPTSGQAWGSFAKANPGAIVGALGLGYDVMNQGNIPGMGAMAAEAQQAQRTGQELNSYINNGQLPPGFQASMNQATLAAKAQIRSKYAGLGMSGSTAESQDLANVDVQAVAAQAQVAAQLLQSGIQESGVASQLLSSITGINQTQEADTTQAIMNFAAAMGGTPIMQQQRAG